MKMYDQLMNDINRHILVIWQSVGVLIGALATFSLVEKKVVPLEFAVTAMFILCVWKLLHTLDASYWYNRNLAIIANIEKQFLRNSDAKDIQYYFVEHRKENKMMSHLKIQWHLGWAFIILIFAFYIVELVQKPPSDFGFYGGDKKIPVNFIALLPFVTLLLGLRLVWHKHCRDKKGYIKFITESPGRTVAHSINFEGTHGQ